MIFRISGEGQFVVPADALAGLNALDAQLTAAVAAGDENAFHRVLEHLTQQIRDLGTVVAAERLIPSDVIIPAPDSALATVQQLLAADGLIPG